MLKRVEAFGLITRTRPPRRARDRRRADQGGCAPTSQSPQDSARRRRAARGRASTNSSTCIGAHPDQWRCARRGRHRRRTIMKRPKPVSYPGPCPAAGCPTSSRLGARRPDRSRGRPPTHDPLRDSAAADPRAVVAAACIPVRAPGNDAPILIWSLFMALALNKVWRRDRRRNTGLTTASRRDRRKKNVPARRLHRQVRAAPRRGEVAAQQQPVLTAVERLDDLVRRAQVDACLLAVGLHRGHLVA